MTDLIRPLRQEGQERRGRPLRLLSYSEEIMKGKLKALSAATALLMLGAGLFGCGGEPPAEQEDFTGGFLNTSATDDYGRSFDPVSGYEEQKYVGIFYFLWNGADKSDIKDVSENYEKNHTVMSELLIDPALGGTQLQNAFHYWGKPLYDYYCAEDKWVIRKHIELFVHAGLDFIAFDTSNARIYDNAAHAVLEVLLEYQQEGFDVPEVMFMTPVNDADSQTTVRQIYNTFYASGVYDSLWFRGNRDKPWIIGTQTGDAVVDSAFYFKKPQWPNAQIESSRFPWMDWNYPQDIYTDLQVGNIMSVSVAQHTGLMGKSNGVYADFSDSGLFAPENRAELAANGFDYSEDYIESVYNANWGRGFDREIQTNSREGALRADNFESQWKTVLDLEADGDQSNDIDLVFVTGWNEWIAQKQANSSILGGDYGHFVDLFNMEFSRDIEMTAEYLDTFYLSLVRNVRAYKGTGEGSVFEEGKNLSGLPDGSSDWSEAQAVYRDFSGETLPRAAMDATGLRPLDNNTGRNDIREIRVMSDAQNLYFRIRTEADITAHEAGDTRWMNLYLGVQGAQNGWQGLQYVINREPGALDSAGKGSTSIHRIDGKGFQNAGTCEMTVDGNTLYLSVPKSLLGLTSGYTLTFKVADNLQKDFDVAEFYVNGDVAPIGRMCYNYTVR